MTICINCLRPWGVMLERGELPSERAQQLAQLELEEELMEYLEYELTEGQIANLTDVPKVEAEEVVFITEALSRFASDHLNCDMMPQSACWCAIDDVDLPAWVLKGRARRWTYRWDCCNLSVNKLIVTASEKVGVTA